jgi:hypothetical protein
MKFHKIFTTLFLISLILLSISTATALTLEGKDVKQISNGNGYYSDDDDYNVICVVSSDGSQISLISTNDGSQTNLVTASDDHNIKAAFVSNDGYLYFATQYGIYKKITRNTNPIYTNQTTAQHGIELIVISSDTTETFTDVGNNVYYSYRPDDMIKGFSKDDYLTFTEYDFSDNADLNTVHGIMNIAYEDGDWWIFAEQDTGTATFFRLYKNDEQILDFAQDGYYERYDGGGFQLIGNNKFMLHAHSENNVGSVLTDEGIYWYNGTYIESAGMSSVYNDNEAKYGTFYLGQNVQSIAYVGASDTIQVISSDYIGISTYEGIPQNEYQEENVASLYDTYYQDQTIQTSYRVATSIMNSTSQEYYKDTYLISVELLDENGTYIDSYYIDGSEFTQYDFTNPQYNYFQNILMQLITDEYLYIGGYKNFANNGNWIAGNYTLKMYEVNKYSGNKVVLDTDTFEIYNNTSPYDTSTGTNTDIPDSTPLPDRITTFLNSGWFFAIAILLACTGIAKRSDGGYSSTGLILAIPIGLVIAVAMGYIPVWVLFLMFFVVLFAIMANRGGD